MEFGFIDFSLSCRDAELRGSVLRLGGFQLLARGGLQIKESLRSVTNPQRLLGEQLQSVQLRHRLPSSCAGVVYLVAMHLSHNLTRFHLVPQIDGNCYDFAFDDRFTCQVLF